MPYLFTYLNSNQVHFLRTYQCCEGIWFVVLKPRIEGQILVTQTQAHIFLLKLAQEQDIVTSDLQDLDPKLE